MRRFAVVAQGGGIGQEATVASPTKCRRWRLKSSGGGCGLSNPPGLSCRPRFSLDPRRRIFTRQAPDNLAVAIKVIGHRQIPLGVCPRALAQLAVQRLVL